MSKQIEKTNKQTASSYEELVGTSSTSNTTNMDNAPEHTMMVTGKIPEMFGKMNKHEEPTYEWPDYQPVNFPSFYLKGVPLIGRRDIGPKTIIYTEGPKTLDNEGPLIHDVKVQFIVDDDEERYELLKELHSRANTLVHLEIYRQSWDNGVKSGENVLVEVGENSPNDFGIYEYDQIPHYLKMEEIGIHNIFKKRAIRRRGRK